MLQHIFNQYTVPSGGVLYKHMCYGPGQLTILYNRAAAHALYNPPCQPNQLRICHLYNHALILMAGISIHLLYFNGIIL